ncbi:lactaldehyde reductase [Ructibacterium gallinarum]|uniref:Lactaldehyde reductase n=1 Tax=Ructibacterium gallinarum TaxID=2779355 RepID=A0A9D5M287_9FIRM|nr:lactaldehyde reductase [Ructibacterium gallinarum]MBE5039359.1 lactaldehyde reductase [Ructibacterium gallinarum]
MANRFILNETSYFGAGARENAVTEVKARGLKKILFVTDKVLLDCGVATKVTQCLEEGGVAFEIYSEIKANPTVKNVQDGVAKYKECGADGLIAVGGGSVMDTAKAISIIIANPEFADVVSLEGVADTKNKGVPLIALPTTSGTAAEVTINYVITDEVHKKKMVCVDPHDIPVVAIVDSELMMGMPKGLCASTGMDALTHAIEGYITPGAWELSDMVELRAIELIHESLYNSVNGDPKARETMALAQYIAGMGFSNVGLGIVHSMAHPLGAFYDTPHGVANALLLPYVLEYNAESPAKPKYRAIAKAMGVEGTEKMTEDEAVKAAIDAVRALSLSIDIPQKLGEIGVKEEDLQDLSVAAFNDVCTGGNPRPTSPEEILEIYKKAF